LLCSEGGQKWQKARKSKSFIQTAGNVEKYFPCLKKTTTTAQVAENASKKQPSCSFYAKVVSRK
jgi:hypothetical protein